jgi:hypothetical protein
MRDFAKVSWRTRDDSRYVESIMLNGRPTFRVSDPRHIFQPEYTFGTVPIITRTIQEHGEPVVIFADLTVRGLRRYGVELADLVPDDQQGPERDLDLKRFTPVTSEPGESSGDLNQRRYAARLAELLEDIGSYPVARAA